MRRMRILRRRRGPEVAVLEGLKYLVSFDRPAAEILRDFADIFVVAFIMYRGLLVLKGTRAMQMGLGFVAFGILYVVAKYAELATLMSLLSWLATWSPLILVVVFQNDIRRALIRVGSRAWLSRSRDAQVRIIEEVVQAATELARHRIGALIALERDANVLEFVKNDGVDLDSVVTSEVLVSLFLPETLNKTHDGAVLIRDLRIAKAGLFFPMPETTKVQDPTLGSRHRAAVGITEETDAVVVVVSEERGAITLVFKDGTMVPNLTGESLREALLGLFGRTAKRKAMMKKGLATRPGQTTPLKTKVHAEKKDKAESTKSVPPRSSVPPPPPERQDRTSTSKSGGFRPLLRAEPPSSADERSKTPSLPRVSMPMPLPRDRKPSDASIDLDDDDRPTQTPGSHISKPMVPTELPPTTLPSDDQ
jgi:diadenylate cyclase